MELQKKKGKSNDSSASNNQLKYHRKMRHWTQAELADALYLLCAPEEEREKGVISAGMICGWEKGAHMPSLFWQKKLCILLEATPDELGLLRDVSPYAQQNRPLKNEKRVLPVFQEEGLKEPVSCGISVADQLPQLDATVHPSGAHKVGDSVVSYPQEHMPFSSSEVLTKLPVSWVAAKELAVQALVAQWHGRAMYCEELQMLVDQELRMFDRAKLLRYEETFIHSRRRVLSSLAALPLVLFSPLSHLQTGLPHPEEFLPECAASITACWSLLKGDGLATVERTLPAYLPTLVTLARQSSSYQRAMATLGSQGSLLMVMVDYHHCRFQDQLAYANQAVELARLSGDPNLLAYALLCTSWAYHWCQQPHLALQTSQEAAQLLPEILPLLQSAAFANLARAYTNNGMGQEALRAIGEARTRFPTAIGEVPCYIRG